jgi:DnaJ family protein C protein 17
MDVDVDHYLVLGLPSGEEGAKLSVDDIKKAYRSKALELHPDKRPGNKQALADFQRLQTSYEILKDEKARKLFDDLLRVKREQQRRQSERSSKRDAKRQKMVSDLEEREQAAFAPDPTAKEREEEERIAKKLREEIARIRAMHTNKGANMASATSRESSGVRKEDMDTTGARVDKEKVLKVSWEKVGEDYTAEGLRELFSKFGEVDDVVIKSSKKKGSALVVMATKDAAVS